MNSIQLTEEHKSKLLEMCEKLFPEYDFTLDKWEQCFVTLGLKTKDLYETHIYWFEFCITHLPYKLKLSRYQITRLILDTTHPVDYLYDEFKRKSSYE